MQIEGDKKIDNRFTPPITKKPLLSIITVVYNGEKYLTHTIQSVVTQINDEVEYIIIDGGSNDNTLNIIKSFDNQIDYWISEPDKGISDAFNKGIKLSRGELIGILNSDDWYEPGAFEKIINCYRNKDADVFCGSVRFWQGDKAVVVSFPDISRLKRETSIHHAAVFIKKSIYEKLGLYNLDYNYAMDYELLLRFLMNSAVFIPLNEIVANRRLDGISYSNKNKALLETVRARKRYFSVFNVYFNLVYVWTKDNLGRLTKNGIFSFLYRYYWKKKNQNLAGE